VPKLKYPGKSIAELTRLKDKNATIRAAIA